MKNRRGKRRRLKRFDSFCQAVQFYCSNTTIHGLKYVTATELSYLERLLWLVTVILSSIFAIGLIYVIAKEFQNYPTSISIKSTNYKTSGVPFPSVVICPNQHVDWKMAMDLEKKIFPNSTIERNKNSRNSSSSINSSSNSNNNSSKNNSTSISNNSSNSNSNSNNSSILTFRKLLRKLSIMSFGDFDLLTFLKDRDLTELAGLFSTCWWRNSYYDCCEIFEVQKTEYGFCYSFNSELSEERVDQTKGKESKRRARRTSGYGEWSGVRLTMHLKNINKPPDSEETDGGSVMIQGPRVWPNSGTMIPVGVALSIALDCISGYATQRVLELDDDRMPSSTDRDCNVTDLICLAENNDIFNSYYVLQDQQIADDKPGMICDCPPECEYYFYKPRFTIVPISGSKNITMDVHFETQTSFRYKTDIVLSKFALLVSFGGIIGLFLGGSLLSAVELVYYLLVLLYCYVSSWYESAKRKVNVQRGGGAGGGGGGGGIGGERVEKEAVATVIPRLPILDYGPLKSRSRKIPNLLVYDYAKQKPDRY
ncbi:PREDICTED: pickpocket protein 19-like [Polistes canadensis]|uniref:pickpocket protein 19-like n=1 Tax=Polistes canadensis TaxID=91411 RepID=UPI000718E2DC|nr:PREDICTED: pickpocket protein 19-like [Polistes canadensis]